MMLPANPHRTIESIVKALETSGRSDHRDMANQLTAAIMVIEERHAQTRADRDEHHATIIRLSAELADERRLSAKLYGRLRDTVDLYEERRLEIDRHLEVK